MTNEEPLNDFAQRLLSDFEESIIAQHDQMGQVLGHMFERKVDEVVEQSDEAAFETQLVDGVYLVVPPSDFVDSDADRADGKDESVFERQGFNQDFGAEPPRPAQMRPRGEKAVKTIAKLGALLSALGLAEMVNLPELSPSLKGEWIAFKVSSDVVLVAVGGVIVAAYASQQFKHWLAQKLRARKSAR